MVPTHYFNWNTAEHHACPYTIRLKCTILVQQRVGAGAALAGSRAPTFGVHVVLAGARRMDRHAGAACHYLWRSRQNGGLPPRREADVTELTGSRTPRAVVLVSRPSAMAEAKELPLTSKLHTYRTSTPDKVAALPQYSSTLPQLPYARSTARMPKRLSRITDMKAHETVREKRHNGPSRYCAHPKQACRTRLGRLGVRRAQVGRTPGRLEAAKKLSTVLFTSGSSHGDPLTQWLSAMTSSAEFASMPTHFTTGHAIIVSGPSADCMIVP